MLSMKLATLLAVGAVVAFAASSVVTPVFDGNVTQSSSLGKKEDQDNKTSVPDFTDDEDDDVDDGQDAKIDEISLKSLINGELNDLLDDKDNIVQSDLDICVLRKTVEERKDDSEYQSNSTTSKVRVKRFLPFLFAGARLLFQAAIRAPKPTFSGSRITQQYIKRGTYRDAVNQFNALRPNNVKTFSQNGISGRTGTVGNHRVTVRDGSKQGAPTLEIRTPQAKGEYVRKFRYER